MSLHPVLIVPLEDIKRYALFLGIQQCFVFNYFLWSEHKLHYPPRVTRNYRIGGVIPETTHPAPTLLWLFHRQQEVVSQSLFSEIMWVFKYYVISVNA